MVLMTTLISPLTRIPCRAPAKQRRRMAQIIIFLFFDSKHRCLSSISSSTFEDSLDSFSELSCVMVGTLLVENIPGKTLLVIFCMESSTALIFSSPFLASDPFFSPVLMNNNRNSLCCHDKSILKLGTKSVMLGRKVRVKVSCGESPSRCQLYLAAPISTFLAGQTLAPVELCLFQSVLTPAPTGSNNLIVMHQHFPDWIITTTG